MQEDLPFRVALVVLYTVYTLIRLVYRRQMQRDGSRDLVREPAVHEWGLRVLIAYEVATLVAFVSQPQWWDWSSVAIPGAVRWAGAPLGLAALALLAWTHHTLGANFRPTLRVTEDQALITAGPYRMLRHPMYTAFGLLHLGAVLLMANAFLAVTWLGGLTLLLVVRIPREEAMMLDQFGDTYRALMQRTGRLLPRFGGAWKTRSRTRSKTG